MLERESMKLLLQAAARLDDGFAQLPAFTPAQADEEKLREVLFAAADRLRDNFPYFHPLYAGQMLKPPHPVARLAYMLSLWINPNNHALDGGRASSRMEKEAVAELAALFGWREFLGHLCGGGTMANLEALWVAGQERPGLTILASEQAHYTHNRISAVLRIPFESVPCDSSGRMDAAALAGRLARGGVGAVVATLGTTATGAVDPLPEILDLCARNGARVHVDAAYGGYFLLAENLGEPARQAFARIGEADSIVIDPHKHGLQPYGCGCVLFRDPAAGRHYKHDSPYTYFSSTELHLGEISLECSRPGASAVALWATQKLLPLVQGGEFARGLEAGRRAALSLQTKLRGDARFVTAFDPELDLVIFASIADSASASSALSRRIFECAAKRHLHLALAELPVKFFAANAGAMRRDRETLTALRMTLMKPEHEEWLESIWGLLSAAADEARAGILKAGESA